MPVYDICEMIPEYFAESKWLILFCISMINFTYLYFRRKKLFIVVSVILAIAIFNNLSISIVEKFSGATFYRNLWLIPVPHLITASVILFFRKISSNKVRYGIIAILLMLLISNSNFKKVFPDGLPQNKYLLSDEIPILYDAIKKDLKFPNSRPRVLMSTCLWWMFNEYDAEIINISVGDEFINSIQYGWDEVEYLKIIISSIAPQYVILATPDLDNNYLESLGFREIIRTNSFVLYKVYISGINREIVYDDKVNETREYCYDINDNLVLNDQGYAVSFSEYDKKNRVIKKTFYGMKEQRILNVFNVAEMKYEYNNLGRVISKECYGVKGERVLDSYGVSKYEYDYDDSGNLKMECYYGVNNEKINLSGYWKVIRVYDENNKVVHEEYYDDEGELALAQGEYAMIDYIYDENEKISKIIYRDLAGCVVDEKEAE